MKRLHVHISVDDLASSVDFYATLFGDRPNVLKADYAKWSLEDPRVNFAISQRGRAVGLDHLGIQVDSAEELQEVGERLAASGARLVKQKDAACCYARSDKAWVNDPQGIAWETFHSHGEITVYGEDTLEEAAQQAGLACCEAQPCGPSAAQESTGKGGRDGTCCG